jgi:hypothetical protein
MPDYQRPDATGKIIERRSQTTTYYRRRGKRYVDQVRDEIHDPNASLSTVVDHFLVSGRRYKLSSQAAMTAWLRQIAVDGCADPSNEVAAEALRKLEAGPGPALVRQIQSELGEQGSHIGRVIECFFAADGRYTTRSQDALVESLNAEVQARAASGAISRSDEETLLARLRLSTRPKLQRARRGKNTSAKKLKSMNFHDFEILRRHLAKKADKQSLAASRYLAFGVLLGLRPGEFRSARLEGTTLHWIAEKTSAVRGNAKNPELHLKWPEQWMTGLRWFLEYLKPYRDDDEKWTRFTDRLRARIAYACKSKCIARISLYITRDLFIASELLAGTDPLEVAAKVNHRSERTQRRHYAKKGSGFPLVRSLTSIDPARVQTVLPVTPFSPETLSRSLPKPMS